MKIVLRQVGAWATALALVGCGRGPFGLGVGETEGDNPCLETPEVCSSIVTLQRAVDILFVIDNSGSMGDEQGTLAANFPAFIEVLEAEDVGASYRIGVTTSDTRGLRLSSCRQRLSEFVWQGRLGDPPQEIYTNEQADGCLDPCAFDLVDTVATRVDGEDAAVARPWLEKSGGRTNLAQDISISEALSCIGPQGINGNGLEAPLESMYHVLTDQTQGFLRDDALLAVIFVTDEADCSMAPGTIDVLASDTGRPLWSDPTGDRLTSAVCWNAGVTCVGGPGVYETCFAQDKGFDGQPTDGEQSVLYPVQRYVDALRSIAEHKESRGGNGQVLVAVLAGVPEDYPESGELTYRDSTSAAFNREYGIGPGCNIGQEEIDSPPGIPPVRLREFAEAFATEERNIFSICSEDYAIALEQIAEAAGRLSARACVPGCVTDTNRYIDGLQPRCTLVEEKTSEREMPVQSCVARNGTWEFPGPEVDVCYRALSDVAGLTSTAVDDMSPQCITRGANLEFVVERRPGIPIQAGTAVRVDCELDGPSTQTCLPS